VRDIFPESKFCQLAVSYWQLASLRRVKRRVRGKLTANCQKQGIRHALKALYAIPFWTWLLYIIISKLASYEKIDSIEQVFMCLNIELLINSGQQVTEGI
jgi:hypothetical protein